MVVGRVELKRECVHVVSVAVAWPGLAWLARVPFKLVVHRDVLVDRID